MRLTLHDWARLLVATLLLFGGAARALADPPPGNGWPVFRGNPAQTGVASAALPEPLTLLWQFKTQGSIEATAVIANASVYFGSLDGHLYALDLTTGKQKWAYTLAPTKAVPGVRTGAVHLGDSEGTFHCVDAASGKARWTATAGSEIGSGTSFGAAGDVLFGSADEHLHCLTADGKARWKFHVPGGPVLGSPAVVGDRIFLSGCDRSLHVLNASSGKAVSTLSLSGQAGAAPAVAGEHVYLGLMSNELLAIDWKKPTIAWRFQPAQRPQPFYASAAVTDALVVAGSRDKRVYALDRQTGKVVWSFATTGRVDSSPVVAGKRVYVGSLDGKLYVLALENGAERQRFTLDRAIAASPALGDGRLVIGTTGGILYCFGARE